MCEDLAKAAPCSGVVVQRMSLVTAVIFSANSVHLCAIHAQEKWVVHMVSHLFSFPRLTNGNHLLQDVLLDIEGAVSVPTCCVQVSLVSYLDRFQFDLRICESLRGKRAGDGSRLETRSRQIELTEIDSPGYWGSCKQNKTG